MAEGKERGPIDRRGGRVPADTLVFIEGAREGDSGMFVDSAKLEKIVNEIFDTTIEGLGKIKHDKKTEKDKEDVERAIAAAHVIRKKYLDAVESELGLIADLETTDPSQYKKKKSSILSSKFESFKNVMDNTVANASSDDKDVRLIPELYTQKKFEGEYKKSTKGLLNEEQIVLVTVDLDDFKRVNDRLGDEAGDNVLISFGLGLFKRLRSSDSAAHFSGDQFAFMLKIRAGENAQAAVASVISDVQGVRPRTKAGESETQGVSSGYILITKELAGKIDFTSAREMADQARKISKLQRVVPQPDKSTKSKDRVTGFQDLTRIESGMDHEEVQIGAYALDTKRAVHEVTSGQKDVEGNQIDYSLEEVKEIGELIRSGQMKKILEERRAAEEKK